ncbi:hypothetical protein SAMD00019534_085600 [Acytostelium subglobosum LB1]|uniref:hypothetical protein n=1 Tax=Acytostelium subglobosum LB1 TaxID=1410327 RepID=UPI00064514AD|nr:hypothetical protein SAMD00019534_085600 [Acytostelium subglobosum LB1]GAM25385.1 hypothetical protein SAMD00019534_085600 [Acytostelium subglobosum LB1]|eukprot:XP_012751905.1 hypothetical protein SAMD00019534_085600 [Acytostelium subglobosum LB1]
MPYVLSFHQDLNSTRRCQDGYCTLSGDKLTEFSFNISGASAYGNCIVMYSNVIDGGMDACDLASYNIDTEEFYKLNMYKATKCTNIAVDDRFIWVTSDGFLDALIHEKDCSGYGLSDKGKPFNTEPEVLYADPATQPDRSLITFDRESKKVTQFSYPTSVDSMFQSAVINVGDACSMSPYGTTGYVGVGYADGFRVYDVQSKQYTEYPVFSSTGNFCGPFTQNGVELLFIPVVGGNMFEKIIPGFEVQVNDPCVNASNGQILLRDTSNLYNFTWLDTNGHERSRNSLAPGRYVVHVESQTVNISSHVTIVVRQPQDPTKVAITHTCQGSESGRMNFILPNETSSPTTFVYTVQSGDVNKISKSGKFDSMPPGTYVVDVTSTDKYGFICEYTSKVSIIEEPTPSPAFKADKATCTSTSDGSITITNYNPSKYTYILDPPSPVDIQNGTFTKLSGLKEYSLTVQDRDNVTVSSPQCSLQVAITIPGVPVFNFPSYNVVEPSLCFGDKSSIQVDAMVGVEYNLVDSLGNSQKSLAMTNNDTRFRNLPAGVYTLDAIVLSNDTSFCRHNRMKINITVPEPIQASPTTFSPCSTTENLLVSITGGVPNSQGAYLIFAANNSAITSPYLNVSYWPNGEYTVNITDSHGCVHLSSVIINRPSNCSAAGGIIPNPIAQTIFTPGASGRGLAVGLGVGLGVGIPALALLLVAGVMIMKRRKRAPVANNTTQTDTIPVYMGGKIQTLDNF